MRLSVIILVFIASCNLLAGQYSWQESYKCNSTAYLEKIDSLRALIRTDDGLEAIEYSNKLLFSFEKKNLIDCEAYYYTLLEQVRAYTKDLKLEKAQTLVYELIEKIRNKGLFDLEASCYIELELIYEFFQDWDECKKNLEKALILIEKHNLRSVRPKYYVRLSSYLRFTATMNECYESALKAVESAIAVGDRFYEQEGYLVLGICAENTEIAVENFSKTAEMYAEFGDPVSQALILLNIAKLLTLEDPRGKLYLDSSQVILEKAEYQSKDYFMVLKFYHSLQKDKFIKDSQMDSALVQSELEFEAEKKAMITENSQKIEMETMEFDLQEMRHTLEDINADKDLLKLTTTISIVILSIFGILLLVLRNNRRKVINQAYEIRQKNTSLKASNDQNAMLLSEIHHRVKNNLQNIMGLIHLKQSQLGKSEEVSYLDDISSKIFSMSLIHEQLYQEKEFAKVNIRNYVTALVEKFRAIMASDLEINFDVNADDFSLNTETIMPFGIILTEMITNSIKHNASQTHLAIYISLHKNEELIQLEYSDTGKGIANDEVHIKVSGLNIIEGLARQLKGKYSYDGSNGFKASLSFKEKKVSAI